MAKKKFSEFDLRSFGTTRVMTGAIYSGEGESHVVYFPGEMEDLPVHHVEMTVDDWSALLRQTDLIETEVLAKAKDGKLVKAFIRKSERNISQNVSWKVYKRDSYACRYCGDDNTPLTVDHLVTWETGGPSIEANLVAACKKCNRTRGNISYEEWLKHPHYVAVSKKLKPEVRSANEALLGTLEKIPRKVHIVSR
jgi:hypothetical protein